MKFLKGKEKKKKNLLHFDKGLKRMSALTVSSKSIFLINSLGINADILLLESRDVEFLIFST